MKRKLKSLCTVAVARLVMDLLVWRVFGEETIVDKHRHFELKALAKIQDQVRNALFNAFGIAVIRYVPKIIDGHACQTACREFWIVNHLRSAIMPTSALVPAGKFIGEISVAVAIQQGSVNRVEETLPYEEHVRIKGRSVGTWFLATVENDRRLGRVVRPVVCSPRLHFLAITSK